MSTKPKVLIVDDEPDVLLSLRVILEASEIGRAHV